MARSEYVYVVFTPTGQIAGAFTVKKEALAAVHEQEKRLPNNVAMQVVRVRDGQLGSMPVQVHPVVLEGGPGSFVRHEEPLAAETVALIVEPAPSPS